MKDDRLTASVSMDLAASADEVWRVVGDFGGLARWHPWVPACELSPDGQTRTMRVGDEIVAVERLLESTPFAHVYTVDQGPFPMTVYRAELSVASSASGCRVRYHGRFRPTTTEVDVAAKLQRFFEQGERN